MIRTLSGLDARSMKKSKFQRDRNLYLYTKQR